jgi:hypothetical protein
VGGHVVRWRGLCLVAVVAACSGGGTSSDGPSGAPPLTVPPSTPIADLNEADETTFCTWAGTKLEGAGLCRYQGVLMGSKKEGSLQERRDACASEEQRCLQGLSNDLAKVCREDWLTETCRATADELGQCMSKLAQNYVTALSDVPACSALELDTAPQALDVAQLFVGCESAKAECPSLLAPNRDGQDPDPTAPAILQLCEQTRDAYAAGCGMPSETNCSIMRKVYGEECDVQGERFYECAKTASFDCAETDLSSATQGCSATLSDYLTCYALDGASCKREPSLDTQCEQKAGTPFATRCVSDAVPADCVPALGAYYCCPTE